MKKRKPKPPMAGDNNGDNTAPPPDAFYLWLNRGLHELYDNIAQEPVPEELLKLIEEDRSK